MSSTFLSLISDFSAKWGLPVPGGVVGATEATARQLLALTHEVTEDLQQFKWQNQNVRKEWIGLAAEDQGTLASIFGAGYRNLVPKTMWNLTTRQPISGPTTAQNWQALKAVQVGGSLYQFRVAEGKLFIYPALAAADSLSAIYTSKYGVLDASSVLKERVTADDDTFIYTDNVFKAELEWRWLKQKGEAWAASRDRARELIASNVDKDNALGELNLGPSDSQIVPGIWVPAGSWNV